MRGTALEVQVWLHGTLRESRRLVLTAPGVYVAGETSIDVADDPAGALLTVTHDGEALGSVPWDLSGYAGELAFAGGSVVLGEPVMVTGSTPHGLSYPTQGQLGVVLVFFVVATFGWRVALELLPGKRVMHGLRRTW